MSKRQRIIPVWLGILVFLVAFIAGAVSKFAIQPSWAKEYSAKWSDEIGTLTTDLPYGVGDEQKFDLYLPKDNSREAYGLAVYLHAGGFTSGDKSGDRDMLAWLCKKGYVAAGINYTLARDLGGVSSNGASVYTQSNEIKAAIPEVIKAAAAAGYPIDKMTIAGGSAGHALAMIYAYRDAKEAPVPVVFTFGAVGPSCFYREDWDCYGMTGEDEQSYQITMAMFSAMLGELIPIERVKDGSYLEMMKPISAMEWITPDAPPTVVAYGTYDRVQSFKASLRLKAALEKNGVDFRYFEMPHSGHGLQNDSRIQKQWIMAIDEYLDKYMPL
ncbi:MAG: alpha/beta hydrolase [Bacteroidales bacterium]|nr:alpha/beta hydrolase [Bacteroidales bacterium]